MLLNFVFRVVPIELTAAMIAIEMPAAMRPYSMAVAPDWSARKAVRCFTGQGSRGCGVRLSVATLEPGG